MSGRWWPQFDPRWFSRDPAGLAKSPLGTWLSPWALNEGTAFHRPGCPGQWLGTTAALHAVYLHGFMFCRVTTCPARARVHRAYYCARLEAAMLMRGRSACRRP
eukprot:1848801-Prymnesium_polylepis.1